MKVAVIGSSLKENERRVSIHPEHIPEMTEDVRFSLYFEKGYGEQFGVGDETLSLWTQNECYERDYLISTFDKVIIPKPVEDDVLMMKENAVLWGWIHAVQQQQITQIAIDKNLTYLAWENMFYKNPRGRVHIFQTNNEMAGYCAVQHAFQLRGIDGYYGIQRKIKVMSFGSVSRGALFAIMKQGFTDIEVYTWRAAHLVGDQIHSIVYNQLFYDDHHVLRVKKHGNPTLASELADADIIVNGILQDPEHPIMFIKEEEIGLFMKECLIIDVSCDENMGFPFARPTSFEDPIFRVGPITYYGVDHTPSLLWDSSSYQISLSLKPYLHQFIFDNYDELLEQSVDIRDGKVLNPKILSFQHRDHKYPYPVLES